MDRQSNSPRNERSRYTDLLRMAAFLAVGACSTLSAVPEPSSPFFEAEGKDLKFYRAAARSQDVELTRCAATGGCDRAHFTRGLIALFESREAAAQHFQEVIALAPRGHLAASSRTWMQLLEENVPNQPESLMAHTTKRLVRDMIERELSTRRELALRERKVEELTVQLKKAEQLGDQLEALKRIEQEIKERSRPMKPSTKISRDAVPGAGRIAED